MICKISFVTKSIADFLLRTDNSPNFPHLFPWLPNIDKNVVKPRMYDFRNKCKAGPSGRHNSQLIAIDYLFHGTILCYPYHQNGYSHSQMYPALQTVNSRWSAWHDDPKIWTSIQDYGVRWIRFFQNLQRSFHVPIVAFPFDRFPQITIYKYGRKIKKRIEIDKCVVCANTSHKCERWLYLKSLSVVARLLLVDGNNSSISTSFPT